MPLTMFADNQEGLNTTDSPMKIRDAQATGQSYNYDYATTGAITKVLGSTALNSTPDTELKSIGLAVHHSATTDVRTVIRAAGTRVQVFEPTSGSFTNQTDDTASAGISFLTSGSEQPVVFAPFNTNIGGTVLWMAGGGLTSLIGYTGSNVTTNGTPIPTGSVTPVVNLAAGGTFITTGTFFYSFGFRKTGTQTISNAALDVSAVIAATTSTVTLPLTAITNVDTTKYDKIYIYRSAVSGVTGFTTGDLIGQVAIGSTSFTDTGTYIATAESIPRAGSVSLDNSVLGAGTYNVATTFRRRLVTAVNSTFYLSDLDKPESWPIANSFTIPTGGPILAMGTIGVPSEYTTGSDQYLCIWKEDELWVFTGDSSDDWALYFVDKTGCLGQSLVVPFNGFISWLTSNGVYIWDGRGKPSRISRPIQSLFNADGDIDKPKLMQGYGAHYRSGNQVIWRISHKTKGVQKYSIKMDTRLSATKLFQSSPDLQGPELDGVFIQDSDSNSYYALCSFRSSPGASEQLLVGDDAGYVYNAFSSATVAVDFNYETRPLDFGMPQNNKRFKRVIAFVEKLTVNDLTLLYWADNRVRTEYQSKVLVPLSPSKGTNPALWDIALWDQAYWDDYSPDISPVEFHLHSTENNTEGTCLKLRFVQSQGSAPVRIHGFAVDWEDMGPMSISPQQV